MPYLYCSQYWCFITYLTLLTLSKERLRCQKNGMIQSLVDKLPIPKIKPSGFELFCKSSSKIEFLRQTTTSQLDKSSRIYVYLLLRATTRSSYYFRRTTMVFPANHREFPIGPKSVRKGEKSIKDWKTLMVSGGTRARLITTCGLLSATREMPSGNGILRIATLLRSRPVS